MIYCRECKLDKSWRDFVDDEGRVSSRCRECRSKVTTGPQTPMARRAIGKVSSDEEHKLIKERETEPPPESGEKCKK